MKYLVALITLLILGCSGDPYEECVAKKQDAYRQANPKADYSKASAANEKFRKECQYSKNK